MLALKLTLVPLFLLLVSMSGRWWGPSIAGWLAGLPVVAGPILLLVAVEHGPAFGAQAALLSLSAIAASEAFNFAYAWTCRQRRWPLALAAGLAAWAAAASVLVRLPATPLAAMAVALVAICVGQSCLPRGAAVAPRAPLSRADLAGRLVAGAALALAVTSLSGALGAAWSGVLAVFPLLGSVLSVSSHRAHGPDFVIHLLRAMVLGRFSFAAFCLCVALALPHQPAIPAFVEAAALSIVVQGMTRRFAARSARPPALTRAAAPD
ncbi:hypothetical protein [Burkholderia thailandensis]|uniref:hypothetical protein n=1 Tax=Burkholderia thailandensis TaxID=57975 RepID=UPI0022ABF8D6|nr:hypothetical protein [Burkholderia thailandensis]MCZ2903391.1 hypothetical protein [Burkholderia thailandensis]MDD1484251.1 hypothetical protein [Burkholderia thailandensis]MDD1489316.1 hypothetical protein [Burkholderia thailandensis]MDD1496406.1 hypothetical protein [Burkholderia thailandensis]